MNSISTLKTALLAVASDDVGACLITKTDTNPFFVTTKSAS